MICAMKAEKWFCAVKNSGCLQCKINYSVGECTHCQKYLTEHERSPVCSVRYVCKMLEGYLLFAYETLQVCTAVLSWFSGAECPSASHISSNFLITPQPVTCSSPSNSVLLSCLMEGFGHHSFAINASIILLLKHLN